MQSCLVGPSFRLCKRHLFSSSFGCHPRIHRRSSEAAEPTGSESALLERFGFSFDDQERWSVVMAALGERKTLLKQDGMTAQQVNKDETVIRLVARMNKLKPMRQGAVERIENEQLRSSIRERKLLLAEQGIARSAINKDEQIAAWVARLTEISANLKDNDDSAATAPKAGADIGATASNTVAASNAVAASNTVASFEPSILTIQSFLVTGEGSKIEAELRDLNGKVLGGDMPLDALAIFSSGADHAQIAQAVKASGVEGCKVFLAEADGILGFDREQSKIVQLSAEKSDGPGCVVVAFRGRCVKTSTEKIAKDAASALVVVTDGVEERAYLDILQSVPHALCYGGVAKRAYILKSQGSFAEVPHFFISALPIAGSFGVTTCSESLDVALTSVLVDLPVTYATAGIVSLFGSPSLIDTAVVLKLLPEHNIFGMLTSTGIGPALDVVGFSSQQNEKTAFFGLQSMPEDQQGAARSGTVLSVLSVKQDVAPDYAFRRDGKKFKKLQEAFKKLQKKAKKLRKR